MEKTYAITAKSQKDVLLNILTEWYFVTNISAI
jgi:hypothetical protein